MAQAELDQVINRFYTEKGAHGKEHALETARLALEISWEPEYLQIINDDDRFLIATAAAFHDAGYLEREYYWSGIQDEHPYESAKKAIEFLRTDPEFTKDSNRLKIIAALILNHDNTSYTFPDYQLFESRRRQREGYEPTGQPHLIPGTILELPKDLGLSEQDENISDFANVSKFIAMLQILQEADSRLGSPQRTIEFSQSREIPIFANDSGIPGIGLPMWQRSGSANVLLALKRALLDAYTKKGQEIAWQMFLEGRDFIKRLFAQQLQEQLERCTASGKKVLLGEYPPDQDNIGELLRYEDMSLIWDRRPRDRWRNIFRDDVYITEAIPLEETGSIIKEVLELDKKPLVASRLVDVANINSPEEGRNPPLTINPQELERLRNDLIANYALDVLTETSGILKVKVVEPDPVLGNESWEYTLVPPILSVIHGLTFTVSKPPYTLLSGQEWVNLAKELGLPKIRVLFVR